MSNIFHPTEEEFKDFVKYIEHIEKQNVHIASGICKIIPPPYWSPRPSKKSRTYHDVDKYMIEGPMYVSL
uniref:JmjN domain-containing protein n=1 Tax=Meloidogyne enterolobii TaxID=390850 RepID=A0A6V7VDK8_MELEN|nr:unnamed protein product [Meloidogyne enterolobii]